MRFSDDSNSIITKAGKQNKPVKEDIKTGCLKLARKYLSENAVSFYTSLRCSDEDSETDDFISDSCN